MTDAERVSAALLWPWMPGLFFAAWVEAGVRIAAEFTPWPSA